jgi:hypothetical protein
MGILEILANEKNPELSEYWRSKDLNCFFEVNPIE